MGVLYDYFRAKDDAAAVRLMKDYEGGPFAASRGGIAVDAVDLKGIEPTVTLGKHRKMEHEPAEHRRRRLAQQAPTTGRSWITAAR
ncbi:hypothetical protein ACQP2C_26390 [Micromonospora zamorensis]|uniref:hypothetical protein n=1 Tax=Micromonospora zamorensis TaxID=709883 RepID=UPI003D99C0C5